MRTHFMLGSMALLPCLTGCSGEKSSERPNILFIMSDDHALAAISAYGSPLAGLAPTPNIDRIARDGAIFHANYCCNSISGPSRAAILTGKHSHKNGFMRNWAKGFDGTQQTLPKIMQANGYQTAVIGKWHLVSEPTGFDYWSILHDQGEYNHPDFITGTPNGPDTVNCRGYVTDIITGHTREWLDGRDPSKPFFLMMHHKAAHRNWIPAERHYRLFEHTELPVPETYFDDYDGRRAASWQEMNIYRDMFEGHDLKMVDGVGSEHFLYDPWPHASVPRMDPDERERFFEAYRERNDDFYLTPRTEEEVAVWKYQRYLQDYLAVVRAVDESVGEMLDYLKANGLDDNTIVVYTSDQGFYLGEHGWFDKRFMYEESMIMPMVMRWPAAIKPGTEVKRLTQNIDFAPTFLDMCGIGIPEDMQGVSFLPLLKGESPADWRTSLYYHYYEFPGFHSVRRHFGIKEERYKLINFYRDGDWELFDLETDPHEMHNIYGQPGTEQITARLKVSLDSLQTVYDVPAELCR